MVSEICIPKNAEREISFMLYNYENIEKLIDKRKNDLIDTVNVTNNAHLKAINENGKVIKLLRGQAKLKLKRNMKILSKLKESKSVDEDYINVRLTAFYAHICHSNARSLYRRIKKTIYRKNI